MSEAFVVAKFDGGWGRGAASAFEWVVAVVATLLDVVLAGIEGDRRLGECCRDAGGD